MTTCLQLAAQPGGVDSGLAPQVLLVDDQDSVRQMLRCILEEEGYRVTEARNGAEALTLCRLGAPDLVLTDLIMPEKDGLETIVELRQVDSSVPVIAMSGGGLIDATLYLAVADTLGATLVLEKPFSSLVLVKAVAALLASPPQAPDGASQREQHLPSRNNQP